MNTTTNTLKEGKITISAGIHHEDHMTISKFEDLGFEEGRDDTELTFLTKEFYVNYLGMDESKELEKLLKLLVKKGLTDDVSIIVEDEEYETEYRYVDGWIECWTVHSNPLHSYL